MKIKKIFYLLALTSLNAFALDDGLEKSLLKAACDYKEPEWSGSFTGEVEKPIKAWGGEVILYYIEGCGGGNFAAPHLALVINSKVVSHAAIEWSDKNNETVPFETRLGSINNIRYTTKTNCKPGVVELISKDKKYSWVYGYDEQSKALDTFGGECQAN